MIPTSLAILGGDGFIVGIVLGVFIGLLAGPILAAAVLFGERRDASHEARLTADLVDRIERDAEDHDVNSRPTPVRHANRTSWQPSR